MYPRISRMKPSTFPLAGQLKALRDTGNMPVVKGEQDQSEAEQVQICPEELPEAAADPSDLLLFWTSIGASGNRCQRRPRTGPRMTPRGMDQARPGRPAEPMTLRWATQHQQIHPFKLKGIGFIDRDEFPIPSSPNVSAIA